MEGPYGCGAIRGSLLTQEGNDVSINRVTETSQARKRSEFLPHHPLRGSFPRWGKHYGPTRASAPTAGMGDHA